MDSVVFLNSLNNKLHKFIISKKYFDNEERFNLLSVEITDQKLLSLFINNKSKKKGIFYNEEKKGYCFDSLNDIPIDENLIDNKLNDFVSDIISLLSTGQYTKSFSFVECYIDFTKKNKGIYISFELKNGKELERIYHLFLFDSFFDESQRCFLYEN